MMTSCNDLQATKRNIFPEDMNNLQLQKKKKIWTNLKQIDNSPISLKTFRCTLETIERSTVFQVHY